MWMLYTPEVAIAVNIVLGIFFAAFILNGADIFTKLYISEEQAVSSQFQNFASY